MSNTTKLANTDRRSFVRNVGTLAAASLDGKARSSAHESQDRRDHFV
jgi:hypothetical protein